VPNFIAAPAPQSTSILSNRILKVRRSRDLSASEKIVARGLLDHIGNKPDGICWPSLRRIAAEAALSVRTAQRALRGLIAKNFIRSEDRFRENRSQTSSIYVWIDAIAVSPATTCHPRGDTVSPLIKDHKKQPTKKHVCCLEQAPKEKPSPKRFIKFADRSRFNSFSECEKACAAATSAGFLKDCESDRLVFWTAYAAICRRLKSGKVREPARLLRFLIDSRPALSSYGTDRDEAAGFQALKNFRRQALPS